MAEDTKSTMLLPQQVFTNLLTEGMSELIRKSSFGLTIPSASLQSANVTKSAISKLVRTREGRSPPKLLGSYYATNLIATEGWSDPEPATISSNPSD